MAWWLWGKISSGLTPVIPIDSVHDGASRGQIAGNHMMKIENFEIAAAHRHPFDVQPKGPNP